MLGDIFGLWWNVITKPKQTFAKEKKNASYGEAIKQIGISGVISGLILGLFTMVFSTGIGYAYFTNGAILGLSVGLFLLAYMLVLSPLVNVILLFLFSGTNYVFAKIFDADGDFETQTYLFALVLSPFILINGLFAILIQMSLSSIMIVGGIFFIVLLYEFYLLILAIKAAHDCDIGKALLVMLPLVIILFVAVLTLIGTAFLWASTATV